MLRHALHSKIHRATVTYCEPDYMGSITIDADLLDAVGLRPNEKVLVSDVTSGSRFETYVFKGERGSGVIGVNGAAARLSGIGHLVIIMSFCILDEAEFARHQPRVALCTTDKRVQQLIRYDAD